MAMKFLVTFLLLISIGEIYSKTLLEKIRDDSDLSQVSFLMPSCFLWGFPFGSPPPNVLSPDKKEEAKILEKNLASARSVT